MPSKNDKYKYDAFISYARASDDDLAPNVLSALQRFPRYWTLKPASRIYLDKNSLYEPGYEPAIKAALKQSKWFLLMASEVSAKSPYVCEEIMWWLESDRLSNLRILLTDGDIQWDRDKKDFDWAKTTALPEPLFKGRFTDMPLWIDFREVKKHGQYDINSLLFRDPIATIAACLQGKPKDELDSEDIRERKKATFIRRIAITFVFGLALGLAGFMAWSAVLGNKALQNGIAATANAAEIALNADMELEALLSATKAGKMLQTVNPVINWAAISLFNDHSHYENSAKVAVRLNQILGQFHERNRLEGHDDSVTAIANSPPCPDGSQFIVSAGKDGKVIKWARKQAANDEFFYEKSTVNDFGVRVNSVAISPDCSEFAAAGANNTVKIWKRDGIVIATLNNPQEIKKIVYVPDSNELALADDAGNITISDYAGQKKTYQAFNRVLIVDMKLQQCLDGTQILLAASAGNKNPSVVSWKLGGNPKLAEQDQKPKTTINFKNEIKSIALSPDCGLIAVGDKNGGVALHHIDGKIIKAWLVNDGPITSVNFNSDGQFLVSGGETDMSKADLGNGNTVKLWKIDTKLEPDLVMPLKGHRRPVTDVLFSRDSQAIVSASADKTIRIWSINNLPVIEKESWNATATKVEISADGGRVLAVNTDDKIEMIDLNSGNRTLLPNNENSVPYFAADNALFYLDQTRMKLSADKDTRINLLGNNVGELAGLKVSPDGKRLALIEADGGLSLLGLGAKKSTKIGEYNFSEETTVFSPDGKLLAAVYDSGGQAHLLIRLVDGTGNDDYPIDSQEGINQILFSPDGKTIATAGKDRTIRLWDLAGKQIGEFVGHDSSVTSVAFHNKNNMIASVDVNGTLIFWDGKGQILGRFNNEKLNNIWDLGFSQDGKWLVAAGQDSVTRWKVDLQELLQLGCNVLKPYLSTNPNVSVHDKQLCQPN